MTVKIYLPLFALGILTALKGLSQTANDTINKESVKKMITYLASDELKGRVNYSKEQLEAAEFINKEFSSFGLEPFPGFENFYQPFRTSFGGKTAMVDVKWNDKKLNDSLYYFFSRSLSVPALELSDFLILRTTSQLADSILYYNWNKTDNILLQIVLDDTTHFSEAINNIKAPGGMPASNILIVGVKEEPVSLKVIPNKNLVTSVLYNVIGIIPGRSLPHEAIIFSAHYDHVNKGLDGQDGLFNGANDDASGTTAVLELAKYFSMRKDNERTIIFCLFAGEELGLLGSQAFINYVNSESIKAVINIEMIGIANIEGKNTFMLTGSGYSSLYKILKRNLKGDDVKIAGQYSDPQYLFRRSDNYTFAQEGIPAHTIMGSDDSEPCYHKPCDDVQRIDIENMTKFIKAIAKSASTLISGKDTPTRIKGF
ncbi:MAG: M28 family peptidase [Chitinophagaceae bacterium]|nr:M28 family peptidase [Chitinophagaceae bacterium]